MSSLDSVIAMMISREGDVDTARQRGLGDTEKDNVFRLVDCTEVAKTCYERLDERGNTDGSRCHGYGT
jgi:hypothetical protein